MTSKITLIKLGDIPTCLKNTGGPEGGETTQRAQEKTSTKNSFLTKTSPIPEDRDKTKIHLKSNNNWKDILIELPLQELQEEFFSLNTRDSKVVHK